MAEKKFFQKICIPTATIGAVWTVASALTGIAQGVTQQTRIGDKIRVQKIEFQINISPVIATMNAQGSSCKWNIYHNKQANGALVAATTVYDSDSFFGLRNVDKLSQVRLVKSGMHTFVITATTSAGLPAAVGPTMNGMLVTIYPNKVINYTLGGSAIADLVYDDFGIMAASDTANCCQINVQSRVFFTDY
jgi:hypothetical protein